MTIIVGLTAILMLASMVSWLYMMILYFKVLPIIKVKLPDLYTDILNGRANSWVELGFNRGRFIDVQLRSLKAIYNGDANAIICRNQYRTFKYSCIVLMISSVLMAIFTFSIFGIGIYKNM